ncbi:MAG: amidohydrolase family protein [Clostridia bacterium]|nr:amidohydrolase family protein [Clostridia bacterium]
MRKGFKIFDAHTHVFPEKIAAAAVASLEQHDGMKAVTDGTLGGLKRSMAESGTDISLILPVMTAAKQFESVNRFAEAINGRDGILSFGGIHPDCDEPEEKLAQIRDMGLRGIKLHPDYQHCYVDDPRYIRIIRECLRLGLFVTLHTGYDPLEPIDFHANVKRCAAMLDAVEDLNLGKPRIILAHLGGGTEPDEVERLLAGRNVFLDTAYLLTRCDGEKAVRIIRKHGTDKVLFASDSPWSSQGGDIDALLSLPFSESEKRAMLWDNAETAFLTRR